MQEEVENKTVALVIRSAKLTGEVLKKAVSQYLAHIKEESRTKGTVRPMGKQTVKELIGQNQGVASIEITEKNIKGFDWVARKYGVDYAVKKDKSQTPPKYIVFFKARDTDALTSAFEEYTHKKNKEKEKPSVMKRLREERSPEMTRKTRHKEKVVER